LSSLTTLQTNSKPTLFREVLILKRERTEGTSVQTKMCTHRREYDYSKWAGINL